MASGGRYDGAGAVFGRIRPATGFSLDLRRILNILPEPAARLAILASSDGDDSLKTIIADLRKAGERVIVEFPDQIVSPADCDRKLVRVTEGWQVVPL